MIFLLTTLFCFTRSWQLEIMVGNLNGASGISNVSNNRFCFWPMILIRSYLESTKQIITFYALLMNGNKVASGQRRITRLNGDVLVRQCVSRLWLG